MICSSCRAPHYGPRSLVTGLCRECDRIYRACPPAPVPECPTRDADDVDRLLVAQIVSVARHGLTEAAQGAILSLVKHFRATVASEISDSEYHGTCAGCDGVSPFHDPPRCRLWEGEVRC